MRSLLAIVTIASIGIVGCSTDDGANGADASNGDPPMRQKVTIRDSRYQPAETTVLVGGSVTWVNRDLHAFHTAETRSPRYRDLTGGESQAFDTHTLAWGEPYTVTFHKPGTYEYYCSLDMRMEGEVHVVVRERPQ